MEARRRGSEEARKRGGEEAGKRGSEEAGRRGGEEASNVICHIMTHVNVKVGYNVKSEVSNHWVNCLNRDNLLNP